MVSWGEEELGVVVMVVNKCSCLFDYCKFWGVHILFHSKLLTSIFSHLLSAVLRFPFRFLVFRISPRGFRSNFNSFNYKWRYWVQCWLWCISKPVIDKIIRCLNPVTVINTHRVNSQTQLDPRQRKGYRLWQGTGCPFCCGSAVWHAA